VPVLFGNLRTINNHVRQNIADILGANQTLLQISRRRTGGGGANPRRRANVSGRWYYQTDAAADYYAAAAAGGKYGSGKES